MTERKMRIRKLTLDDRKAILSLRDHHFTLAYIAVGEQRYVNLSPLSELLLTLLTYLGLSASLYTSLIQNSP